MKCGHYSKRMLDKQDFVKFRGRIAWQSFFENNFADFSNVVRVKNQDFVQPLVAFPISNISYWIRSITGFVHTTHSCKIDFSVGQELYSINLHVIASQSKRDHSFLEQSTAFIRFYFIKQVRNELIEYVKYETHSVAFRKKTQIICLFCQQ